MGQVVRQWLRLVPAARQAEIALPPGVWSVLAHVIVTPSGWRPNLRAVGVDDPDIAPRRIACIAVALLPMRFRRGDAVLEVVTRIIDTFGSFSVAGRSVDHLIRWLSVEHGNQPTAQAKTT